MSPTAFKDQVASFVVELTRCYELCTAIRTNRRLPAKTEALDKLQASLASGVKDLQYEFNHRRRAIGSRMDLGDEIARQSLQRCIRELQSQTKVRLNDVAYKRNGSEVPGFRDIYATWKRIENNVSATIESLGRRLEIVKATPVSAPAPLVSEPPKRKTDEVIVTVKEFHRLTEHLRNSWTEKVVAGRLVYVNCLGDKRITTERPDGFIQSLPRANRTKSWEREEVPLPSLPRRTTFRQETWNTPGRW